MHRVVEPSLAIVSESQGDRIRRLAGRFEAATFESWRTEAGPDEVGGRQTLKHALLVGFPRLGTTLLKKMLAMHSSTVAFEEAEVLRAAGNASLSDGVAMNGLAGLTVAQTEPVLEARIVYRRA